MLTSDIALRVFEAENQKTAKTPEKTPFFTRGREMENLTSGV
jgi:hypothetical protein